MKKTQTEQNRNEKKKHQPAKVDQVAKQKAYTPNAHQEKEKEKEWEMLLVIYFCLCSYFLMPFGCRCFARGIWLEFVFFWYFTQIRPNIALNWALRNPIISSVLKLFIIWRFDYCVRVCFFVTNQCPHHRVTFFSNVNWIVLHLSIETK